MKIIGALTEFQKILMSLQVETSKNPTTLLYSETKNRKYFLNRKNVKVPKREHAFKGNASTYNAEILKFF